MEKVSKTLTGHLARVNELAARLDCGNEKTRQIDVDMMLDALRDMYDFVHGLNRSACIVDEPVPEAPAVAEPDPKKVEPVSDETAVLFAEVVPNPVFAEEEDKPLKEPLPNNQPSMEELEGSPNDDLFESEPEPLPEPEPELVVEPEPLPEPEETEEIPEPVWEAETEAAPKTIWDKLQDKSAAATIGESVAVAKTVSDMLSEEQQQAEEKTIAEKIEENPVVEEEPEPAGAEEQQESAPEKKTQPSLFDYLSSQNSGTQNSHVGDVASVRTIADTLAVSHQDTAPVSKVTDLRTVININDKFSFMNELFHNNMKGYNDFIIKLNSIVDREEALEYVRSIAQQYKWDENSVVVKTFYSIFDRKF